MIAEQNPNGNPNWLSYLDVETTNDHRTTDDGKIELRSTQQRPSPIQMGLLSESIKLLLSTFNPIIPMT